MLSINVSMTNRVANSTRGYIRQTVLGDGDCGYTAFGITRSKALDLLQNNIDSIRDIIQLPVEEALLTEEFYNYLCNQNILTVTHRKIVDDAALRRKLTTDLGVQIAYIEYDVRDRRVDLGWAHPSILQALAHIRNVELHMWQPGENDVLIPHVVHGENYAVYRPDQVDSRVDLLFVNGNHFDRLDLHGYGNDIPNEAIYPQDSSWIRNNELERQYLRVLCDDKLPEEGSDLTKILRANPKVLSNEFDPDSSGFSYISKLLTHGSLHAADFLLKKDDDFISEADPWYCGEVNDGLDVLLVSAGVSFYLALTTLQIYSKENRLSELISISSLGKLKVKKTHYDCIYWNDLGTAKPVTISENDSDFEAHVEYKEKASKWFLTRAHDIFAIEKELKKGTHGNEVEKNHQRLCDYYLHVALMEDSKKHAFNYFLLKAIHHCELSPQAYKEKYKSRLQDYADHKEKIFEFQFKEKNSKVTRTLEDWIARYHLTEKRYYVIDNCGSISINCDLEDEADKEELLTTTGIEDEKKNVALFSTGKKCIAIDINDLISINFQFEDEADKEAGLLTIAGFPGFEHAKKMVYSYFFPSTHPTSIKQGSSTKPKME